MKKALVTIKQAKELRALGFHDEVSHYTLLDNPITRICVPYDHNRLKNWLSMPTCDEAIDWLRRKYDVMIYNTAAPFVDPGDPKSRITHNFSVKHCNRRDGWNSRTSIGYAGDSYNVYAVKRRAISIAIEWLKQRKNVEKSYKPGQLVIKKVRGVNQLLRIARCNDMWTCACANCIIQRLDCVRRIDEKMRPVCLWCIDHLDGDCFFKAPLSVSRQSERK